MPFKARLKRLVGRSLSPGTLEKLTEYSIAEREPKLSLADAELVASGNSWNETVVPGRVRLWERTLEPLSGRSILLLEFGVFQGESMRGFIEINRNSDSRFFGFDSFEGLPELWRGTPAGHFSVGGNIPDIADPRVRFVKGWFRDTLPPLLDELEALAKDRALVIHYDADLYSSTLYLLFTLGARFRRYHFIFDEFSGHETRALYNYMQATGAEAKFHYRLDWGGMPQIVSGELSVP